MIDERPEVAPTTLYYRPLDGRNSNEILDDIFASIERYGEPRPEFYRLTIVSPEYPQPPYPDGWYFEGWEVAPENMTPLSKPAPFNYPLTAPQAKDAADV